LVVYRMNCTLPLSILLSRSPLLRRFQHFVLQHLHDLQSLVSSSVEVEHDGLLGPVLVPHTIPRPRGVALASVQPDLDLVEAPPARHRAHHHPATAQDDERVDLVGVTEATEQEVKRRVSSLRGTRQIELLVPAPVASVGEEAGLGGRGHLLGRSLRKGSGSRAVPNDEAKHRIAQRPQRNFG
ncbi:hypothetical protein PENTCL1PPCAC_29468, partial [Pristionchus entomophagus]